MLAKTGFQSEPSIIRKERISVNIAMKPKVTVIDYGIGNIFSIANVLDYFGAEMILTSLPAEVAEAERLILPGVGAFRDGMEGLRIRNLTDAIHTFVEKERPFLGICLGMQMMLDLSEEFGEHEGLGLIPGRVVLIPNTGKDGTPHKIPHIGWNIIKRPENDREWEGTILQDIPEETAVYFVHSFSAVPENEEHRLADTFYNGRRISAVITKGYLYGCQFHPEKSGDKGLFIIKNFLEV